MHVEFLENKAIERGADPTWLFDIDSLTKSMNYVPVDAGTNSTNLSGTKDAASQEVKKDVSSLRYISLPNWVHDALLESSLRSLKMIAVLISPVPTTCFTDSQEPSSDARLISKRVANQVETPSLDNILTLTNRFEDILGVTTNSVDSDGVEADVSNMETTITANPTPTLRIHKDHPKSQIIRPVDTPIQTRTSPKRIEAIRLFLAYASFMGFTVYHMDVKSAFLYDTIDEKVYVMQPPGFQDPEFPAKVYKVKKAMYGLHQAPRACIFLTQDKYVGDILKKFRYSDVRSSNTPMDKENPWGKDRTGKDVHLHLYRSMIGSLMYLTASRPDIMFAVC
nr:hypothetical protein [Tanacetum cinerariifolium]